MSYTTTATATMTYPALPPPPPPPLPKLNPHLTGVPETLLFTLWCRALDASSDTPILADPLALPTCGRIDYNFSAIQPSVLFQTVIAVRSAIFDSWAEQFIAKHCGNGQGGGRDGQGCTVVHLACGLDSRYRRVVKPELAGRVRWVDVDLPSVVAVRARVMDPPAATHDYTLMGADVLSTDPPAVFASPLAAGGHHASAGATTRLDAGNWLDAIPRDRPTLILAEGLMTYLPPDSVRPLLSRLVRHFGQSGGELGIDVTSSATVTVQWLFSPIRRTGASLLFGLDRPEDLEGLGADDDEQRHEKGKTRAGLRVVEGMSQTEDPRYYRAASWASWVRLYMWALTPFMRNPIRNILYEF